MLCRNVVVVVLAVLWASVMVGAGQAAPSLEGYTGLLFVPTAHALNHGDYNVAAFGLDLGEDDGDEDDLEDVGNVGIFAANLGVADGVEVGLAHLNPDEGDGETLINAKYQFRPITGTCTALAVGVIDATDEVDTTVYAVASQPLSKVLTFEHGEITNPELHIGIGGGRLDGLFGGLSITLGGTLTLMAEYDTEDINLGARLWVGSGFLLEAGFIDGLDDFAFGASYNKTF